MVVGIIKTRHIITHPAILIGMFGFLGYVRVLLKSLDSRPHRFVDFVMRND
jgi:hypothetical protein